MYPILSHASPYVQVSLSELRVSVRASIPFWAKCLRTCRYAILSCLSVSLSELCVSVRAGIPFWATCFRTCKYAILSCVSVHAGIPFWAVCFRTCRYPILSHVSPYVQVSHSEPRVSVRAGISFWATVSVRAGIPFWSTVSVRACISLWTNPFLHFQVFNLSEPRRVTRSHHERVRELGWPADLAPPLERLCSVCKDIESWLSEDSHRIAVIHARWDKRLNH